MIPASHDDYGQTIMPQVDPKAESDMYTAMLKQAKGKEQAKSKAKIKAIDAELAKINADIAKEDLLTELSGGQMTDAVQGAGSMLDDLSNGLHPEYDSRY